MDPSFLAFFAFFTQFLSVSSPGTLRQKNQYAIRSRFGISPVSDYY